MAGKLWQRTLSAVSSGEEKAVADPFPSKKSVFRAFPLQMKLSQDPFKLQVGTPCPKRWDDLAGGDAKRFCEQCQKHVHNLSVVSEREQDRLTRAVRNGQRVCVAYHQHADGAIIRRPGWRRRLLLSVRSLAALAMPWIFASNAPAESPVEDTHSQAGQHRGASKDHDGEIILGKPAMPTPTPSPTPKPREIMGDVCIPTPTPPMIRGEAAMVTPTPTPDPGLIMGTSIALPTPTPSPRK